MTDVHDQGGDRWDEVQPAPPTSPGVLGARPVSVPGPRPNLTSDETTMAMLCHLLALISSFIGPLIIWLMKRDESRFVDSHGREALNLVFSLWLYSLILSPFAVCGAFFFPLLCLIIPALIGLGVWVIVLQIMACVQASRGEFKPYPIAIPFLSRRDPYGPR